MTRCAVLNEQHAHHDLTCSKLPYYTTCQVEITYSNGIMMLCGPFHKAGGFALPGGRIHTLNV